MELFGPEFGAEVRHCSPVLVHALTPAGGGKRCFELAFYHSAYAAGVRDKVYSIQTIERSEHFLLARVLGTERLVLLMELTDEWLNKNFEPSIRSEPRRKEEPLATPLGCEEVQDLFKGCLLGGAVGDALGGAVEFMSRDQIRQQFGENGITDYANAYGGKGKITDDTQMTLYTAEGLLRGRMRGLEKGITSYTGTVAHAYIRWLATQGEQNQRVPAEMEGWLHQQPELHHQRAPGMTCLSALRDMDEAEEPAANDSKGCGGVMRVAPVGLFCWHFWEKADTAKVFEMGVDMAALTHGHPSGYLTGGVFAVLIFALADGATLIEALDHAKELLVSHRGHEETLHALDNAVRLSAADIPHHEAITQLGEGWVAEEALAISVYCALVAESFEQGVVLAVNHDGDSDSTGAITGNILGTMLGVSAIPERWLKPLELKAVIEAVAEDLWDCSTWTSLSDDLELWERYPGY